MPSLNGIAVDKKIIQVVLLSPQLALHGQKVDKWGKRTIHDSSQKQKREYQKDFNQLLHIGQPICIIYLDLPPREKIFQTIRLLLIKYAKSTSLFQPSLLSVLLSGVWYT